MTEQPKIDPVKVAQDFATNMMQAVDAMGALLDGVAGYREQCIARGFSPTAAEVMAQEYHSLLLRASLGGGK